MKSAEYVALVTGVYRAALDRAAADAGRVRGARRRAGGARRVVLPRIQRGVPRRRARQRHDELPAAQQPRRAGRPGRRRPRPGVRRSRSTRRSTAGTPIEFWTSAGRFAQPAGPLEYAGAAHAVAPAGARATVAVERSVTTGDRVFRVRNAALSDAARRTYSGRDGEARRSSFDVRLVVGEPLQRRRQRRAGTARVRRRATSSSARAPRPSPPRRSPSTSGGSAGRRTRVGDWDLTHVTRRRDRLLGPAPRPPRGARRLRARAPRAVGSAASASARACRDRPASSAGRDRAARSWSPRWTTSPTAARLSRGGRGPGACPGGRPARRRAA